MCVGWEAAAAGGLPSMPLRGASPGREGPSVDRESIGGGRPVVIGWRPRPPAPRRRPTHTYSTQHTAYAAYTAHSTCSTQRARTHTHAPTSAHHSPTTHMLRREHTALKTHVNT